MIKLQQRLFSLTLVTVCSATLAAEQPKTTSTTPATTPAVTTAQSDNSANKPTPGVSSTTSTTTKNSATAPTTLVTSDTTPTTDSTTEAAKAAPTPQDVSTSAAAMVTSAPIDEPAPTEIKDPYEGFNRFMFGFNEKVDKYFMKPVATFYNTIMPKPLNQGVHNFFNNIGTLPTVANDLLQFNFYQAANDSWRIIVNSTVGIGGLFDVASRINLKYYSNDFGMTLAAWGYENSNYLVLPFFGPSTPRDGIIGIPVDYFAFSVYPHINPQSTRFQVYGLGVVDRRAQLLKFQGVLEEASVDKYTFIRSAYMRRRAHQIQENQHLGYYEREDAQPVADLTPEQIRAAENVESIEATAEPVQPADQPIANASKTTVKSTKPEKHVV